MKTLVRRIVRDRETKEDIIIGLEVDSSDILCLYEDRNGVFVSSSDGRVAKLDHPLSELQELFGL